MVDQLTPPHFPQMNGTSKMSNHAFLDMTQTKISFSKFLITFCGYVCETVVRASNVLLKKSIF